jgi:hypothetical protein
MPADSVRPPDAPLHTVACWNALHDRRKLYKAYPTREEAELTVSALRINGIDAEILAPGEQAEK